MRGPLATFSLVDPTEGHRPPRGHLGLWLGTRAPSPCFDVCLAGIAWSRVPMGKALMFAGASGGRDERAELHEVERNPVTDSVRLSWGGDNQRRRGR